MMTHETVVSRSTLLNAVGTLLFAMLVLGWTASGQEKPAVPSGLLLRPAIPSPEIFGQSNTYGQMSNFKISLRELPEQGNFRVTVKAARYDDALLLDAGAPVSGKALAAGQREIPAASAVPLTEAKESDSHPSTVVAPLSASPEATITISRDGISQVDVHCSAGKSLGLLSLELGERRFAGQLLEPNPRPAPDKDTKAPDQQTAFLIVRLPAGELKLTAK